jgi:uncharacterized membrane protein
VTRWLVLSIVLTLVALAGSFYVYYGRYDELPEHVPVHWDAHGEADKFVPRDDLLPHLLIAPGAMAVFVLLTPVLPWLSPKHFEVDRFRRVFDYVMALVVMLTGYIHFIILWTSFHPNDSTSIKWIIGGICLFFALIGNVLGQTKRNFWMGVRTPWTLASDVVWDRTHRLAAWLFVAAVLLGLIAVLAGVPFYYAVIGIIVAALAPAVYSLVIYKRLEKQGRL